MNRHARIATLLGIAAVCAVFALVLGGWEPGTPAEAQVRPADAQTGIAVAGVGSVWVQPDVAKLNFGVSVTAGTVAEARSRAAEAMQRVQDALRAKGVGEKDIQTQYFSVSPQYSYADRSQPRITGYAVNNAVQGTVRNIDSASEVLDAAVAAGGDAVRVNGISFTVADPERAISQAREAAVKDARRRADELARAAGVGVGRARSIVESAGSVPMPVPSRAAASAPEGGAPTPISPGEQQVQVSVSVVYEIN